jgi:hypothetical protein
MSDITIAVLHDRQKYPDDMEITLANGDKVTVGDWRNAAMPKGDFTTASERWSRREAQLQEAVQGLQSQLHQAIQAQGQVRSPEAPRRDGEITEEDLLGDPVLGPLARRLKAAEERYSAHEERLKTHEDTFLRERYVGKLNELGDRYNQRYNADGKGKKFDRDGLLEYATRNQVVNLDVAYDAWSRADEIEQIRKESEDRGEERGRKKASVPPVPMGRRHGPTKPAGLPESLQDLKDDDVLNDPEMQEAMRGEEQ